LCDLIIQTRTTLQFLYYEIKEWSHKTIPHNWVMSLFTMYLHVRFIDHTCCYNDES